MEYAKLTYHERNSAEFGAKVRWGDQIASSSRTITETSIPGNVAKIYDNMNYDNSDWPINFIIDKPAKFNDWHQYFLELEDWLSPKVVNGHIETEPFYFDLLTDYYVMGYISSAITLTPDQTIMGDEQATAVVTIRREPFIYRRDGLEFESVPSQIKNTEIYEARPLWHIVGSGDLTLQINDQKYTIKGIDNEVYIDCQNRLVYKSLTEDRSTHADFPNNDFPVLQPGDNTVTLSGTFTKFEYKARWRRRF